MNIRIVKVDTQSIVDAIRELTEEIRALRQATNPDWVAHLADFPEEEEDKARVFYTNDREEIIAHHLRRMGKEPRE